MFLTLQDAKKVLTSYTETNMKKAIAQKDLSKLIPKQITDKTGKRTTVWVKPDEVLDTPIKQNQPEEQKDSKIKQLDKEEKLKNKIKSIQKEYPNLSVYSIQTRLKHGIPMDATEVKIYDMHPKYTCEYRDNKGRKQIRYTEEYKEQASIKKFERISKLHNVLPDIRNQVQSDLDSEGMNKNKICAVVVKLIDTCYFRVGNERYTKQNGTYGVTTLRKHHVIIDGNKIEFTYVGKTSVEQQKVTTDSQISKIISKLLNESDGENLFQYEENGTWKEVTSDDIRDYLKEWGVKPKDFRTYHATRICANKLAELGVSETKKEQNKKIKQAVEYTSQFLGHTPSICRKNYINGKVLDAYRQGIIIEKYQTEG